MREELSRLRRALQDARADESGQVLALIEANERLAMAALEAQEAVAAGAELLQRSDRFVAMVVHELRGPLAPLRSCADLLRTRTLDSAGMARVQAVLDRQIEQLARMLRDLASGLPVKEDGFALETREIDLRDVLDEVVAACSLAMADRDQTFERLDPTPQTPLLVDGDPLRLAQVFRNLFDNACKYTPRGGRIILTTSVSEQAISVCVADNGMGIHHEVLPHVFELYVRQAEARQADASGQGIGLAVARKIAQAHGATIAGRSAGPGQGSTFEVLLPRRAT